MLEDTGSSTLTDDFHNSPQPLEVYYKKYFKLTHGHLIAHPVNYSSIILLLETIEHELLL